MKWILSLLTLLVFFLSPLVAGPAEEAAAAVAVARARHRQRVRERDYPLPLARDTPRNNVTPSVTVLHGHYEWVRGSDCCQIHLYCDGVQVGTFRYDKYSVNGRTGQYYRFDGEKWADHPLPYGSIPEGAPEPPAQTGYQAPTRYSPPTYYVPLLFGGEPMGGGCAGGGWGSGGGRGRGRR
jgi:hypothetical protein